MPFPMSIRYAVYLSLIGCVGVAIASPNYDYSTPEKALASLERAYIAKDIEAAVRSKAFRKEAEGMLAERFPGKKLPEEAIASVTRSLELSFRLELKKSGFPPFEKLKCAAEHTLMQPDVAVVKERCVFPDGGHSIQRVKAYKVNGEWKVGEPLSGG
jgi:hypothetical protein